MADTLDVPIKPGWKTSEFWLSLIPIVLGAVAASGLIPDTGPWTKIIGLITTLLSTLGYGYTRTIVKARAFEYMRSVQANKQQCAGK